MTPKETAVEGNVKKPIRTEGKRILVGEVVSDKMDKTIVVAVRRRKLHPLYKKYVTRTKKVKAHDELNEARVGDIVRVVESRPISKEKRWRLLEIVERAQ
ncbi:30S ribosomal protein S17 [Spirochaeta thermophila DSM 6578]|uniref:Small ribosomal subunit protein uS17 n=1 Tax=Winmispira thermophila (strain ATCC 700085 / DSM 6578 / Z-1203) TaxID=869211 RepID=G0GFA8_WINT7|nr:30S ribosomal protein S17 [Spirochaeta thermophila]AEJ60807.1 30S ribosomal protein S17 [Spirochaeta thermophila DSM 6578]